MTIDKQLLWLATLLEADTTERSFGEAESTDLKRRVREIETALRLRPDPTDGGDLS